MRARTREVYEALCEAHRETGVPPTIRLLVSKLGLTEENFVSAVYYALQELVGMGLVEKQTPITSGLYVPILGDDPVAEFNEAYMKALLEGGDGDGREAMEDS